jgi:hypothetical protein
VLDQRGEIGVGSGVSCRDEHGLAAHAVEQVVFERALVLEVQLGLALLDLVERRLRDIDVAVLEQLVEVPEEERQEQRPDVAAVDIGVGVAGRDTAESADEVLVVRDREVVDVAVARGNLGDVGDGQRPEITIERGERGTRASPGSHTAPGLVPSRADRPRRARPPAGSTAIVQPWAGPRVIATTPADASGY